MKCAKGDLNYYSLEDIKGLDVGVKSKAVHLKVMFKTGVTRKASFLMPDT